MGWRGGGGGARVTAVVNPGHFVSWGPGDKGRKVGLWPSVDIARQDAMTMCPDRSFLDEASIGWWSSLDDLSPGCTKYHIRILLASMCLNPYC
jgi:hypothetical protein